MTYNIKTINMVHRTDNDPKDNSQNRTWNSQIQGKHHKKHCVKSLEVKTQVKIQHPGYF